MSVRLMHYDPRWRQEFAQTRSSIFFSCDGWVTSVEHIGSTAISGLIAQPIVDAIATVDSAEGLDRAATLIEGLNFRRREPPPDWADDAIVLTKPRGSLGQPDPTHRVYLVGERSLTLRRTKLVRNWLRANRDDALRFEETKVAQWRRGEGDADAYAAAKAVFFAHVEEIANL